VKRVFVLPFLVCFLAGCITFNGDEVRRPEMEKVVGSTVGVELKVEKFDKLMNGNSQGVGANFNEGFLGRSEVTQTARIWKSADLIREFGFPADIEESAVTHRLIISGTSDEVGSLFGAFLTGLTLYLIPSSATVTTDVRAKLIRLSDGAEFSAETRNSYTLWQQIVFLPTSILGSIAWGSSGAAVDRSMDLYDQFDKAGAFGTVSAGTG
jgi:hypothetical protein